MARYTTQNIPAGACVGTCATVRDSAVRTEWLHSVRVLRASVCLTTGRVRRTLRMTVTTSLEPQWFPRAPFSFVRQETSGLPPLLRAFELSSKPDGAWVLPY
jgi:hypothetical protein